MNDWYDDGDDEDEFVYAERPDRAALKREIEANKALVLRLMQLPEAIFKGLDLSEQLRAAIIDCKRFKAGAKKRQVLYTTGLMRHEDPEAISRHIDALERPSKQRVAEFHQLEQWRDGLLAGDNQVLDLLIHEFPALDIQYLRQLMRNANKEQKANKPPKSARLIFQYLKDLQAAR